MTTVAGTVWPVATRERIVEIWKPDAANPEAPFRTLRRRRWTSPGSIVHRHEAGRLRGSVALFSSLNLDAASYARRGDGELAERFAVQAGVIEQSRTFQRLLAHLASVEPSVVPGVVAGIESVADDLARTLLTDLAAQTEDVREDVLAASQGETHVESAAARVGRVVEAAENLVVVSFDTNAALARAVTERMGLPRTLARAVNRDAPGDFLALVSRQVAPDRIDLKVLPALGLHAAPADRPFSPFDRNDPRSTRITGDEADRLRGKPAALRIVIPVVIDE